MRVIGANGEQVGIIALYEALRLAEDAELDLVEVVSNSNPPVCKVMNFGKFRYDQTKREKENKKTQHQIKVKEVKIKPNIGTHDLETKYRHARQFIEEGDKVKLTCTFRGREMMHPEFGEKLVREMLDKLSDIAQAEAPPKLMGKMLTVVLAPSTKKKIAKPQGT